MRTKAKRHPSLDPKVVEVASWEAISVEARKRIVERRRPCWGDQVVEIARKTYDPTIMLTINAAKIFPRGSERLPAESVGVHRKTKVNMDASTRACTIPSLRIVGEAKIDVAPSLYFSTREPV